MAYRRTPKIEARMAQTRARILGAAHVKDIECIEDITRRVAVETQTIGCARELILSPPAVTELAQTLAQTATQTIDQSADQHA